MCGVMLGRDSFSTNQWGKGIGVSRCHACVHGGGNIGGEIEAPISKRQNVSTTASIDQYELDNPSEEGSFRWVGKGQYTSGVRNGQCAIFKWFKSGTVFEATFFAKDIKANDKATHIIEQFNCARFLKQTIRINQPEVWTFVDGCQCGQKVLIEPFIDGYQKFNSNSGWADDTAPWPRVMQALSHFSYHASGGQFVLCDLQGGVYSNEVILSDPVILSRSKDYGVTDLGPEGISNFFARHTCNEFCKAAWSKPSNPYAFYAARMSTSMIMP